MTITLNGELRNKGEKRVNKDVKQIDAVIPAVMYGKNAVSTPIFINSLAFKKAYKESGESSVISLTVNGKTENVLVQDVQVDPVKSHFTHADFYVVEKGQKVHVAIPLSFVGESMAVKNLKANLVKVLHELNVSGDPTLLPQEIEVDISALIDLDSNILVKDLNLPKGIELYHLSGNDVVASVVLQVEEDLSAPAVLDMSTIEVEKKGKKEEEAAE